MSNYLVTGAAGFIASVVAEMLLERGDSVVGLDNLNDAYDVRMKEHRLQNLRKYPRFTFLKRDVSQRTILDEPILKDQEFQAVINLAARAGVRDSLQDPWVYLDTNARGTLNLLEFCKKNQIAKFIQASTAGVYGDDAPLPTPEDSPTDQPMQVYAASKLSAEALCHAYHFLFDIDITVVRYFNVYGPSGRPDSVMFRFSKWISEQMPVQLNGDGRQSRGFTFVDDIARGTIAALKPLGYEIINLGGHEKLSINDLIKIIENKTGHKAEIVHHPRHPADIMSSLADVEKARQLLDWEPKVSLKEGIGRTVDWYQRERSWAKDIQT